MKDYCFLFDIDGTLLDIRTLWEGMYRQLYQEVAGFTLTAAELRSKFGPPELEGHRIILQGRQDLYPSYRSDEALEQKALELSAATEQRMVALLSSRNVQEYVLPGVLDALTYLIQQGATLACCTGNMQAIASTLLERSSLRPYFEVLATARQETVGRYQILESCLAELREKGKSFDPSRVYVVGDAPSDIRAAKHLGLVSVGVATGHYSLNDLQKENPDYLLSSLMEFKTVL